jgi:hypothetical protein
MIYDSYTVKISKVIISEEKFLEDSRKMSRDYMRIDRKLMMNLSKMYLFKHKGNMN